MEGPNIVPYADNGGMLGRPDKKWEDVHAYKLNGKELTTVAKSDSIPVTEAGGKLNGGLLGSHNHTTADVTDMPTVLATKANASHTHGGGDVTSAVARANKLATARTISLTGDVTGSASFDGSANASITATVADDSHNHTISNVDSLQTTLNGKVPTGRTVTAGNGLSGGGALSANITLTLGTPGSCSTSTSNAVTATSHTHAITGVAAAGHTHNYAPKPTSSSYPVGFSCVLDTPGTTWISNGASVAGTRLRYPGSLNDSPPGTWKNISGIALGYDKSGLFVRTA